MTYTHTCIHIDIGNETEILNWVYANDEESKVNQNQTKKEFKLYYKNRWRTYIQTHTHWRRIEMKSGSKQIEHSFTMLKYTIKCSCFLHDTKKTTTKLENICRCLRKQMSDLIFLKLLNFQFENNIFVQWWWWMNGKLVLNSHSVSINTLSVLCIHQN